MKRVPWSFIAGLSLVFLSALECVHVGAATADEKIVGVEHRVPSMSAADGKPLNLYVWEKHPKDADVKEFATTGKIVFLVHGATTPGRLADLRVRMPITDPRPIPVPTLIIFGDLDRLTPHLAARASRLLRGSAEHRQTTDHRSGGGPRAAHAEATASVLHRDS